MQLIICLTKEDISVTLNGFHYNINSKEGIMVNLTPDAAEELIRQLQLFKEPEKGYIKTKVQ